MIILNAGVPRSGTVLVNAILRQILDTNEVSFALLNPHGPELPELIHELQTSSMDRYKVTLIHTHSWTQTPLGCYAVRRTSLALLTTATRAMSASR